MGPSQVFLSPSALRLTVHGFTVAFILENTRPCCMSQLLGLFYGLSKIGRVLVEVKDRIACIILYTEFGRFVLESLKDFF